MATSDRDRTYTKPPSLASLGMSYGFGSGIVGTGGNSNPVTGVWAPIQLDSGGNLLVTLAGSSSSAGGLVIQGGNTIPVLITGVIAYTGTVGVNATGIFTPDNTTVVNAVSSGNAYLASISGKISNGLGVTGTKTDASVSYSTNPSAPYNFLMVGGRVTNPTGAGAVTGDYATGSFVVLNFAPNGAPYINQGQLDSGYDSVTASIQGGNLVPVFITGTVALTGSNISFDSTSIVNAQTSGNNYVAFVSGKVNTILPISGIIQGGNTIPVNVTGIILTQVTGSVSASFDPTPIVLAQASGNAYLASISGQTNRVVPISGIVTANVTTSNTDVVNALTTGITLLIVANQIGSGLSGLLSSNLTSAAWVTGSVTVIANSSVSVSTNTISGLTSPFFGTPLPSNSIRKAWFIQNLGTGALMVKYSSSMPTTGSLNLLLKGASAPYVGDGASYEDRPAVYTGPISVSGFGGAPCVYNAWEI